MAAWVLLALGTATPNASAVTVRVLGRNGHTRVIDDPYLRGSAAAAVLPPGSVPPGSAVVSTGSAPVGGVLSTGSTPVGQTNSSGLLASPLAVPPGPLAGIARAQTATKSAQKSSVTVKGVLASLREDKLITTAEYSTYLADWNAALTEERQLSTTRRAQLSAVTVLLHDLAVDGDMTAARLPILFLTLERNVQWWKSGSMLVYPDRVQFAGSPLLWEYYPGAGLQLQVLGNFGEADGLYESGSKNWPTLVKLLTDLKSVAVHRAGGLAWEYYFYWEGGSPPWVSAMAQATGLIAMTDGYRATGNQSYLATAHDMLPLLEHAPPAGVTVKTALGLRFLQYSFAPGTDIINAFLQTLIGLDDYWKVSHDKTAETLFKQGNAEAKAELPAFVIGGWSLYQPGVIDDLNYHELVTGFAQSLCKLTKAAVYCQVGAEFEHDLTTPPQLTQVTKVVRPGHQISLRFKVSQLSTVGAVVSRKGKDYLYTKAEVRAGTRSFTTTKLRRGTYTVSLAATDMAGHRTEIQGQLRACPRPCRALATPGTGG